MELLFVAIGGLSIGAVVRYLLPGRTSHGAALLPAVGMIVSSVLWAALTWLGLTFDGGWIWWISLGLGTIASIATGLVLPGRRRESDARMLATLTNAKAKA